MIKTPDSRRYDIYKAAFLHALREGVMEWKLATEGKAIYQRQQLYRWRAAVREGSGHTPFDGIEVVQEGCKLRLSVGEDPSLHFYGADGQAIANPLAIAMPAQEAQDDKQLALSTINGIRGDQGLTPFTMVEYEQWIDTQPEPEPMPTLSDEDVAKVVRELNAPEISPELRERVEGQVVKLGDSEIVLKDAGQDPFDKGEKPKLFG